MGRNDVNSFAIVIVVNSNGLSAIVVRSVLNALDVIAAVNLFVNQVVGEGVVNFGFIGDGVAYFPLAENLHVNGLANFGVLHCLFLLFIYVVWFVSLSF